MKKSIIFLCILASCMHLAAQVPKKVITEHFTNTLCSVCANRNPGFRTNLNAQDSNVLYISYHPSSPYANCIMNKYNVKGNDDRTRFYEVYGSTPRLVIQGTVIPASANYNVQSLFAPYLGQTSPVSMHIRQFKTADNKMVSSVIIKTVAAHSFQNARLYLAMVEDTIDYSAPNGEKKHYHVFRKAFTDSNGIAIKLPSKVGDSIIVTSIPALMGSNSKNMMQIAILHDSLGRDVIQSASTTASQSDPELNAYMVFKSRSLKVYPNPASDLIYFDLPVNDDARIEISDVTGRVLIDVPLEENSLNIESLNDGIYMIRIYSSRFAATTLFRKEEN